ncbi:ATP-binding cassette domain-containing protein [Patescibacteria group bacterium]|nr:ATP-binding cassette domain-containing protein [Patescibacteria group bacterium]MBU2036461.1 ATP-binding cassette domain-containing protein [Patescibacteria group bacterium]
MDRAIVVDHLTKNFEVNVKKPGLTGSVLSLIKPEKKIVRALKNISFSVQPGELVGFIGPNGAGKTTTLKVLSGLLYPTNGFIQVLNYDPWERKEEFLKKISLVMGQKRQLWWDLPAIESFELYKEIYELPQHEYAKNLEELVDLLEVRKILNIQVRKLSLGQRMRLELIATLLHKPEILFLDEPTIGLDVVAQQKIRDFLYNYNRKYNSTILLTSHNMDDVVNLARRVIVIDQGKIIFDGILDNLVSQFAKEKIIKVSLSSEENIKEIGKIGKVKKISYPLVILSVPRQTVAVAAAELLQNFPVEDLTIEETPIEEVIRTLFKGSIKNKK